MLLFMLDHNRNQGEAKMSNQTKVCISAGLAITFGLDYLCREESSEHLPEGDGVPSPSHVRPVHVSGVSNTNYSIVTAVGPVSPVLGDILTLEVPG